MPCVKKKYECGVPQLSTEAGPDVDAVLTTREFNSMLRMFGVNCTKLEEVPFDNLLGLSTGAGTIFWSNWRCYGMHAAHGCLYFDWQES